MWGGRRWPGEARRSGVRGPCGHSPPTSPAAEQNRQNASRSTSALSSASRDQAPGHSVDEEEPAAARLRGLLTEELGIRVHCLPVGPCSPLAPGESLDFPAVRVRARRYRMAHDPLRRRAAGSLEPGALCTLAGMLGEPMDVSGSGYGRHGERVRRLRAGTMPPHSGARCAVRGARQRPSRMDDTISGTPATAFRSVAHAATHGDAARIDGGSTRMVSRDRAGT